MTLNRRDFIKYGLVSSALTACSSIPKSKASKARVLVVGGGYAGATVAKYIRMWSHQQIEVVVIEPKPYFVSCPLSNLVLGGSKVMRDLSFSFEGLKAHHGIRIVKDSVVAINTEQRKVSMTHGELSYDKLIIAPGIDFIYDSLPTLQAAESRIPHAWKAGEQTIALRKQLEALPDGGVFVLSIPKAPYRCPPGPYERVCQVASYFKQHKPRAKVIVLDANPEITSKKALFTKVFNEMYAGMIDYHANSTVTAIDVNTFTVSTEFETVKADLLNIIPPQRAGMVAQLAGVMNIDKRWCEVDFLSYESKSVANVHVIGDAVFSALPKSAHMATSQAKVCANAIVATINQQTPDPAPVFANTCYSYVNDTMAIHVANVYRYDAAKKMMLAAEGGGVSLAPSVEEGQYAQYWANNIWSDTLT